MMFRWSLRESLVGLPGSSWVSFLGGESLRADIPPGFTRIFDGKTTKGWHFSGTVHHGTTGIATVMKDGVLQLTQRDGRRPAVRRSGAGHVHSILKQAGLKG